MGALDAPIFFHFRTEKIMIRRLAVAALILSTSTAWADAAKDAKTVVASQGGVEVTLGDIDAFVQRIPENDRAGYANSPKRLETMIRNMLVQKQLAAEAVKNGLDKKPEIQQQVAMATMETLSRVRLTEFRENLKEPDFATQAEERYLANKDVYTVHGEITVEHVLISAEKHDQKKAYELAAEVERQAKAKPDDFAKLVEKYSEDESKAQNQGRIVDAGSQNYAEAFAEAARKLKTPGEISPIVTTPFGLHVLKLVERKPDILPPYEKLSSKIIKELRAQWLEGQIRGHTDDIRNRPMDANADAVMSLRTRYLKPGQVITPPTREQEAANDAVSQ